MHDIWNPWHGCHKCSEGCEHCYMYYLDRLRGHDTSEIYKTKNFTYPIQKNRSGAYKIQSGELIRIGMSTDFFLEEADAWREEAWDLIRQRPDVKFFILTKRAHRIQQSLPEDWGDGWDNVMLNVTCENQRRTDERLPILLNIPAKHKGIMCAPFIGEVTLERYLPEGQIEQVICGGENYDGARPCHYEWVERLRQECEAYIVRFAFIETGTVFVKDGKSYHIPTKRRQSEQAYKSGLSYEGKPIVWNLHDNLGMIIPKDELYQPHYREICQTCASRLICNGCSNCGACDKK